ncbi:histidine kinase [Aureimonas endophytica]|uniref:histidine kinase n=1 Tax=Aureimonas endophytica TaxID=2027858 RepID=A0A917A2W6_9HYPH|nr:sensor histidine kinase [Aureimonas endophytica]GGE24129.1 histidine kinase [Aureimonas endophytica]
MTIEANTARQPAGGLRPFRFSRLWRRPPLLVHVTIFALAIIVPALLFSAFLILRFSQQQADIAEEQVAEAAEILSDTIDRELSTMITMARVLAASPAIDSGDLADFNARTRSALAATSPSDALLIDPDLRIVADTRRDGIGEPEASAETAMAEAVFQTRQPLVSDVFHSDRSNDFVFHVAVPVIRDDRVVYALAVTRSAKDLGSFVARRNLPATWSAVVVDRQHHRVVAALATGGKLRENRDVDFTNPSIDLSLGELERDDLIKADFTSTLSGWTTLVAVPDAVIGQPITRSWWLLIFAVLLLLGFSAGMAALFGRRLVEPIAALAHQADAIGKGRPAHPVGTSIAEIGDVSRVLAQASRERREAEEQSRFLMREMTHRAKNQYALIAAIARRAAKESANTTEFLDTLSEALNSLARSADLLAGRGWESVPLAELVASQLKAFGAADAGQFVIAGPPLQLNPTAAQTIGLALHELATNAAKYGALSVPDGHVSIHWSAGERFELTWREIDGPPVQAPKRSGFGTLVVQKMTARGLGGSVDMDFAPSGVVWTLHCPVDTVTAR